MTISNFLEIDFVIEINDKKSRKRDFLSLTFITNSSGKAAPGVCAI